MNRESELEHFDHLIDAFAALSCYRDRIPQLEASINRQFIQLVASRPHFDDVATLLGRRLNQAEAIERRSAWICQHAFDCRAYCVGNQIVTKRKSRVDGHNFTSPLIDQIAALGAAPTPIDLNLWRSQMDKTGCFRTLDCLLIDLKKQRLYPVIARMLSDVRPGIRMRRINSEESLFGKAESEIEGAVVSGRALTTLGISSGILRQAFPTFDVVSVLAVLDDPDAGWGFYLADVSVAASVERSAPMKIDGMPCLMSSQRHVQGGRDLDDLEFLPRWPSTNYLDNLPVDRAARCLMVLSVIWQLQKQHKSRLVALQFSEIAKRVEQRFLINYSRDLHRHDIEDCLERGGYLERPRFDSSRFAMTARGVAKIVMFRRLTSPLSLTEVDNGVPVNILKLVANQAKRWSQYRMGIEAVN